MYQFSAESSSFASISFYDPYHASLQYFCTRLKIIPACFLLQMQHSMSLTSVAPLSVSLLISVGSTIQSSYSICYPAGNLGNLSMISSLIFSFSRVQTRIYEFTKSDLCGSYFNLPFHSCSRKTYYTGTIDIILFYLVQR